MSVLSTHAQEKDPFLRKLLAGSSSSAVKQVLQNEAEHRLQIIYTRIDRNKDNTPQFQTHCYRVDTGEYFYPASTVKLPLAVLSLEKINKLSSYGVNRNTPIRFEKRSEEQTAMQYDLSAPNGLPSIGHFIKRALIVSENEPYTRMYEFLGQKYINDRMHELGFESARIIHRFVAMTPEQNRLTNAFYFMTPEGKQLYQSDQVLNTEPIAYGTEKLGNAYINSTEDTVQGPLEFGKKNRLGLHDLHCFLMQTMFPQLVVKEKQPLLTADDYRFLWQYLSQLPRETNYPKYDSASYYDTYVKPFFDNGPGSVLPPGVRVFNKTGWSYGFLTETAYVVDFNSGVEFFLSATLYVNSDGILNDNNYEYDSLGKPFLYALGQEIYNYEKTRKRDRKPDLSAFKISYEQRENDGRPTLKSVDN